MYWCKSLKLLFLGCLPPQQHAVSIDIRQGHCVRLWDTQTDKTVVVSWLLTTPATCSIYRYQTGTLCETGIQNCCCFLVAYSPSNMQYLQISDRDALRQVELLLFLGYLPPQQHAVSIDIRQGRCVRLGDTQTGRTVVVSWLLRAPAPCSIYIDIRQGHCVRLGDR